MGKPMTVKEYLAALQSLGLTRASKVTGEAIGLSVRQCQRIADGEAKVPGPAAKLLRLALRYRLSAAYLAGL